MKVSFFKDRMMSTRFSTLYFSYDEYIFEIWDVHLRTNRKEKTLPPRGMLVIGSKSFIFVPEDPSLPIYKCEYTSINQISKAKRAGLSKKTKGMLIECEHLFKLEKCNESHLYQQNPVSTVLLAIKLEEFDAVKNRIESLVRLSKSNGTQYDNELQTIVDSFEQSRVFDRSLLNEKEREHLIGEATVTLFSHFEHVRGKFAISTKCLFFVPFAVCKTEPPFYRISISSVKNFFKQQYICQDNAMEIHFYGNNSLYFVFKSMEDRDQMYQNLVQKLGEKDDLTINQEKWQNAEMTNYEYIMYLNKRAGRTIHDVSLYPIFPWVIADYESKELDLQKPETFRDFSKPIGSQKGHQGPFDTHISTPDNVIYFLARTAPDLILQHMNGTPTKILLSIKQAYEYSIKGESGMGEVIPEFYQGDGEFLVNTNCLNFDSIDENMINDVELPPWAIDANNFVKECQKALESDYVSEHLHEWIDLIFGCKMKITTATQYDNLYPNTCHDEIPTQSKNARKVDIERNFFGKEQLPRKLFTTAHPKKHQQKRNNIITERNNDENLAKYLELEKQERKKLEGQIKELEHRVLFEKDQVEKRSLEILQDKEKELVVLMAKMEGKEEEQRILRQKNQEMEIKLMYLSNEVKKLKPRSNINRPHDLKFVNKYILQLERELSLARRDEQQRMREIENTHKVLLSYMNKFEDRKERSEKYWLKICELKQLHNQIHDLQVRIQELELENHRKEETISQLQMINIDLEDENRHMKSEIRSYAQAVFALEKMFNCSGTFEAFNRHLAVFTENPTHINTTTEENAISQQIIKPSALQFIQDENKRLSDNELSSKVTHHTPVSGAVEKESLKLTSLIGDGENSSEERKAAIEDEKNSISGDVPTNSSASQSNTSPTMTLNFDESAHLKKKENEIRSTLL